MSVLASFCLQKFMCVCVCSHVTVCMQRSEDNLWDPVLSYHMGLGGRIRAVRFGHRHPYYCLSSPSLPLLIQSSSQPGHWRDPYLG